MNKTLTNSGFRLKLPENAVVCAAGNEASESRSANAMSEPLFGRFAHVYIDTDSEEWLKWTLKRKKSIKFLFVKVQVKVKKVIIFLLLLMEHLHKLEKLEIKN